MAHWILFMVSLMISIFYDILISIGGYLLLLD